MLYQWQRIRCTVVFSNICLLDVSLVSQAHMCLWGLLGCCCLRLICSRCALQTLPLSSCAYCAIEILSWVFFLEKGWRNNLCPVSSGICVKASNLLIQMMRCDNAALVFWGQNNVTPGFYHNKKVQFEVSKWKIVSSGICRCLWKVC